MILKKRRKSMSAVVYLVIGVISIVFALISFTGLEQTNNE
jgi:hypothetical protein